MGSVLHSIKEIISFITAIFILIALLLLLGYMGYSLIYVAPYIGEKDFLIPIYIAIPFPILLFFLQGITAYAWYVFLATAIGISGTLIILTGAIPYFKDFVRNPFSYKHNSFQELSEMFTLNIFFSMLVVMLLWLTGYKPQTPGIGELPLWNQMLQLLHASVYEEVITRTIFLGIPVFAIYFLRGEKISPLKILGGYGKITHIEGIFILVSASIFAAAHVPAWDVWKIAPTFVGGLLLGYLYIRYGIHASIMMHFLTDFISIPMALSSELQIVLGLLMIYFALVGFVFFISYAIRAYHYISPKKPEPVKIIKEEPSSWINMTCPNCGGRVFQYVDENTLRCVNCGTIIKLNEEKDDRLELP